MRALSRSAALLSLVLLGACTSYQVTYDYDVTASYGRYKTFDYYTSKKGTGGTIVIEIVDFKTNQVIWQGAAAGALTGLSNPEGADEVVPKAVRDILSKFPPTRP